jgi:predicted nucleotidyltransferase
MKVGKRGAEGSKQMSIAPGLEAILQELKHRLTNGERHSMFSSLVPQHVEELARRIVEVAHPLRIVLFGSAARGETGPDSDVDVLVVMPEGTNRRQTAQFIHTQLFGIPLAVDVVVATPSDLERHRDNPGLVYHSILEEGRDLYAA